MKTSAEEYADFLKKLQEGTTKNLMHVPSDEPRFIIDSNTRKITIPDEFTFLGVKNDANAETIYFEIDRYFDTEDLSKHTIIVQYVDQSSSDSDSPIGIDVISDIDLDTVQGKIIFGWTISHETTFKSTSISFAIRFYTLSKDNVFIYSFNTLTTSLPILDTLDVSKSAEERYANILDGWLEKMQDLETTINNYITTLENMTMQASFDALTGNLTIKTVKG